MSASSSACPGFDPWRGSKFSFENFQPRNGGDVHFLIAWIKFQTLAQYVAYVEKAYSTVDSDSSVGWGR